MKNGNEIHVASNSGLYLMHRPGFVDGDAAQLVDVVSPAADERRAPAAPSVARETVETKKVR